MNAFDSLLPAAFPALALAHFLALLSPGQDFFLIAAHALRHRLAGSVFICVGVAAGNAFYIALATLGWSGIRDWPWLMATIEVAGALYLLWVGWQLWRVPSAELQLNAGSGKVPGIGRQLFLGLNSALLNPKNALFYMSLMAVILGAEVTPQQQLFCALWMVMVVLLWDVLLAALIAQKRLLAVLQHRVYLLERGAGVMLMGLGLGLFIKLAATD